jgi:hypothetical protein
VTVVLFLQEKGIIAQINMHEEEMHKAVTLSCANLRQKAATLSASKSRQLEAQRESVRRLNSPHSLAHSLTSVRR